MLLIKGAGFLVEGATSAARKFKVSELMIGLTVVALGTSAPEIVVNVVSGLSGHNEVIFGNIIGSNIFNLYLILGVAGLIYPMSLGGNTIWKEIPFSLLLTVVLFLLINDGLIRGASEDKASLIDGVLLILLFTVFLIYIFGNLRKETSLADLPVSPHGPAKTLLMIVGGIAGLTIGGKLVVDHAITLARHYEVSEKLIGLTIISAGTSLPELVTSVVAASRKKSSIIVGNVLGSNIINISLVLGISALVSPIQYNPALNIDFYVLFAGTLLLFIFMFTFNERKLDRRESALYLLGFIGYMVYVFLRK